MSRAKAEYSQSLRNLEEISESIHARRKLRHLWSHPEISAREPGVGAELEFDLDQACDRASSRSTTSGRSGMNTDKVIILTYMLPFPLLISYGVMLQATRPSNTAYIDQLTQG